MSAPLILASTSRYRKALLERLGLPFLQVAPDCDEDAVKAEGWPPQALAERLARLKAASVAAQHPEAVVIASDQLADLDGHILGKPGSAERAVAQLASLSGRAHTLITAVCVQHPQGVISFTDRTTLHFRALDRAALERYVAADQPLDCAGAYKLECRGISLCERIDSADHSAITGLPLIQLVAVLAQLGYRLP